MVVQWTYYKTERSWVRIPVPDQHRASFERIGQVRKDRSSQKGSVKSERRGCCGLTGSDLGLGKQSKCPGASPYVLSPFVFF